MAVYRLEAKIIGRSTGRSATAAAAYRAATRIEDQRTGQSFDYSGKRGVLHSEILAPPGTPDWMHDRAQLWNAVEAAEKRRDAQLARDVTLSLPHELTHDQRVDLVREFLRDEFVARGMVADFSVHAPDREGDQRNHHAHVMLTMRELAGSGFGPKNRDWNKTEQLETWRERWAEATNRHLEQHGHEARVDHRSLADQGIDREPEPKQGPVATEMEREGRPSHAGDDRRAAQARNREREALASELDGVTADLIYLDPDRPRGAAFDLDRDDDDRAGRTRRPIRPFVTTSDGGMVAQQNEALRRFQQNSLRLEQRRAANDPGHKSQGNEPMASKYDGMRDEQAKATPTPEEPMTPAPDLAQGVEPERPEGREQGSAGLSWSTDQSMAAQNRSANEWAKAANAHVRTTGDQDDEPTLAPEAELDVAAKEKGQGDDADLADQTQTPDNAQAKDDSELSFYGDRNRDRSQDNEQTKGGERSDDELSFSRDRGRAGPDYGSLKSEQSQAEPDKSDDDELSFAPKRGGPDLDR